MPIILDREQKTGKKVMYAFGISHADPDVMMRNHDIVAEAGGNCGRHQHQLDRLRRLRLLRKRSRLVLHAHRNGWDILTRHPGLGLDFRVYQQFWRLLGVDQFQINGIGAKYWEPDDSFVRSFHALQQPLFSPPTVRLPVAGSGPMGRPGAGDLRAHRPHAGPALSLRRRRRRPSRRSGGRRARRQAGLGGGGRRHAAGDLRARPSRTRAIHRQVWRAGDMGGRRPGSRWTPALLLAYYGDDLTGSTDVMEALASRGVPTVAVHARADAGAAREIRRRPRDRPCRLQPQRIPGLDGRNIWRRRFAWLKSLGAGFCHYKVCSTFDSSPQIGSIGRALDIGARSFGGKSVPLVVGAPQLKRYTAFGHLFAAYQGPDLPHRPPPRDGAPPRHADGRGRYRPASRQSRRRSASGSSISTMLAGADVDDGGRRASRAGRRNRAVRRRRSRDAGGGGPAARCACTSRAPFVVGSSGRRICAAGRLGARRRRFRPAPDFSDRRDRSTASPWSRAAARRPPRGRSATPRRTASTRTRSIRSGLAAGDGAAAVAQAIASGAASLAPGAASSSTPRSAPRPMSARELRNRGRASRDRPRARPHPTRADRAGRACAGRSSPAATRRATPCAQLGVYALTTRLPLPTTPGSPLCLAHSDERTFDGLEIALKGGQVGATIISTR